MTAVGFMDIRAWSEEDRRRGSLVVLVATALLLAAGFFLQYSDPEGAASALLALTILLVLLFVFEAGVLYFGMRPSTATAVLPPGGVTESARSGARPAPVPPPPADEVLTLKCGECGTVFDVVDTGARPLYHTCPGCGAEGMLKGELTPPPAVVPAPEEPSETPFAPAAPPSRRLKVRCGGCKSILAIEDSGQRPLRHRCPECGKLGEIR